MEFELVATIERYPPDFLLNLAKLAEEAGFCSVCAPDHFHPWSHKCGQSGFSWVWIATAATKCNKIQLGSCVTAPIIRYHPAIVAQAFATLGYLFPNRIYLGVGTGEPMNELPLGLEWPSASKRIEMLDEALTIIRKLWSGKKVSFKGKYWQLSKARLYTLPKDKIPIFVAGTGTKVAKVAGKHADGFITVPHIEVSYTELFNSLKEGAKEVGRDPNRIKLVLHGMISFDEDYDRALKSTRCWASTVIPAMYKYGIYDPEELDIHGDLIGDEVLARKFLIATEPDTVISWIEKYAKMGFKRFQFNNSSPEPSKFIEIMSKYVIPYFKERKK